MERWRDPRLGEPHEVTLPSGTLRYHDAGRGPVLVFVHGYLVNANLWRKLVPLLSSRFRCITPDWPLGAHLTPLRRDADLSPPGMAGLIGDLLDELDLREVTLVGNDSGGAYSQLAATVRPQRIARLVLNSCETPWCTWPPAHGAFGVLKTAARRPGTHRALYQPLRLRATWRLPNTYGWLARFPIDTTVMRGYVGPTLSTPEIRFDGRKAIGAVDIGFVKGAAEKLRDSGLPILCAWAADDRVFPAGRGRAYADLLGADFRTIADSYTYTAEDQPARTAEVLRDWFDDQHLP